MHLIYVFVRDILDILAQEVNHRFTEKTTHPRVEESVALRGSRTFLRLQSQWSFSVPVPVQVSVYPLVPCH